jgi:hypothetical protein
MPHPAVPVLVPVSRPRAALGALGLLVLLAACGGGGGDPAATSTAATPSATSVAGTSTTSVTTASAGTFSSGIVGKSSTVNGVSWDDSRATVVDDRGRRGLAGLEGARVELRGTVGDDGLRGVADRLKVEPELRGTVASVDTSGAAPSFVVGGVTIATDASTVWADGLSAATLVGRRVEVHALRDAAGALRATRVEPIDGAGLSDELRGTVGAAPSGGAFPIAVGTGSVVSVRLAAGTAFTPAGCDASALVAGRVVEVHGTFTADRVLVAQRIECEDLGDDAAGLKPTAGARQERSGLVATVDAAARTLTLGTLVVAWTDATVFKRGTAASLVVGARIEVDGRVDTAGRLVAREIEIER